MSELFHLSGFGFTYPQQRTPALTDVELTIRSGEFWVLCGPSGCGKSTLLRQLKTVLAPHGVTEGEVYFQGTPLREIPLRQQAADIGFVLQSPEQQVVTDKVWHELAFGLESLGCDTPSIRRRVAEMASFFGIQDWFHKSVEQLSGGQKQLLSLASVMVMQPKVLILDEPTSRLSANAGTHQPGAGYHHPPDGAPAGGGTAPCHPCRRFGRRAAAVYRQPRRGGTRSAQPGA